MAPIPIAGIFITAYPALLGGILGAPVCTPVSLVIPDDPVLVGLRAGIQTLTFPYSTFLFGSVTRLYRATVRP
jgi:hypothetical protein